MLYFTGREAENLTTINCEIIGFALDFKFLPNKEGHWIPTICTENAAS